MAGGKKKSDKAKGKKGGKKSGSGKAKNILDGVPMSTMSRDQLEGHVGRLKGELERERDERNYVQMELERLQRLWEVATQALDQERSVARLKDAEIATAEESHQQQMKTLHNRMKNMAGEHEDVLADMQVQTQQTVVGLQEATLEQEQSLARRLLEAREALAKREAHYLAAIGSLKVDHSKALQASREALQAEAQALGSRQERRLQDTVEQLDVKRKTELQEMESRKNAFLETVMAQHDRTVKDLKKYYTDITEEHLREVATLKTSLAEKCSAEGVVARRVGAAETERERLAKENASLAVQVAEAGRALQRAKAMEGSVKNSAARLQVVEREKQTLLFEKEVVMQTAEKLERERDQLYAQLVSVVGEVRQRSEMRNLVLEKKLEQLSEQLEKREAVLAEVLAATDMEPASVEQVTRQLETIIEEKNRAITGLRGEVASMRRLYCDLLGRRPGQ